MEKSKNNKLTLQAFLFLLIVIVALCVLWFLKPILRSDSFDWTAIFLLVFVIGIFAGFFSLVLGFIFFLSGKELLGSRLIKFGAQCSIIAFLSILIAGTDILFNFEKGQQMVGFIALICLCIACGWLMHSLIHRYWVASILSAFVSTILFQVIGYFILGYLDPFFLIALTVGWFVAFIVSLIVGLVLRGIQGADKNP
jgi:hypothetical protein